MRLAGMVGLAMGVGWAWLAGCAGASVEEVEGAIVRRQAALEDLRRVLPHSEPWEKWLHERGELPPDFSRMPCSAYLPELLQFQDGRPVGGASQWPMRRRELAAMLSRYLLGALPGPPTNGMATNLVRRAEGRLRSETLRWVVGGERAAQLEIELRMPLGTGPFPVFVVSAEQRAWATVALSRGWMGCIWSERAVGEGSGRSGGALVGGDWSELGWRVWCVGRAIDYLWTSSSADRRRVVVAGHDRDGAVALAAGAWDMRVSAVVASSAGPGGICGWRLTSERYSGEGIERVTRLLPGWLHPRLRFFAGRESWLPFDQHMLLALVAPRPCLVSIARHDPCESVWAGERSVDAAQRVYGMLGAGEGLALRVREGGRELRREEMERALDWLETVEGRRAWPEDRRRVYPTYLDWRRLANEEIAADRFPPGGLAGLLTSAGGNAILSTDQWHAKREEIRGRILWGMGEAPAILDGKAGVLGIEAEHEAALLGRGSGPREVVKRGGTFGSGVAGDLYVPSAAAEGSDRMPAVIWLHGYSPANGYAMGVVREEPVFVKLARSGFAVLAFDQIGQGRRMEEGARFYQRYPRWSWLGRTVEDIREAIGLLSGLEYVDPRRIYLLGAGTGAMAGMHAAALDDRVAGMISVGGVMPMQMSGGDEAGGGLARWSQWVPWQPRLAAFIGEERHVPYDYHELLALIAPRAALVAEPGWDPTGQTGRAAEYVEAARAVYRLQGVPERLEWWSVNEWAGWSPALADQLVEWLKRQRPNSGWREPPGSFKIPGEL